MKKVLVNGCSFSRGPISWPYRLQEYKNFELTNLALAGAGNTYIHESTVNELAYRNYDLVIIMWSGLSRVDYKVENISLFEDSINTSKYQKTQNDWPEKIIIPANDQDYIDDDWLFSGGPNSVFATNRSFEFFKNMYKYMGHSQFAYHSIQKIISLQNFLKTQNIKYLFTFYMDYIDELKATGLYKFLDLSNIYCEKNIFEIAKELEDLDKTNHPKLNTHTQWAKLLKETIDATSKL